MEATFRQAPQEVPVGEEGGEKEINERTSQRESGEFDGGRLGKLTARPAHDVT